MTEEHTPDNGLQLTSFRQGRGRWMFVFACFVSRWPPIEWGFDDADVPDSYYGTS